jgi:hypothetical protein
MHASRIPRKGAHLGGTHGSQGREVRGQSGRRVAMPGQTTWRGQQEKLQVEGGRTNHAGMLQGMLCALVHYIGVSGTLGCSTGPFWELPCASCLYTWEPCTSSHHTMIGTHARFIAQSL